MANSCPFQLYLISCKENSKPSPVFSLIQNANVRSEFRLDELVRDSSAVVGSIPGQVAVPAEAFDVGGSHARRDVVQDGVVAPVIAALKGISEKIVMVAQEEET